MTQPAPRGVLATLSVTVTISYGALYYAFAVSAPKIAADTGWTLTRLNAAFTAGGLLTALFGILVGRRIQEFGPRAVMVGGAVIGAAGLGLLAVAHAYPLFTAGTLVAGLGASCLFYPPAFATLTHWYGSRRVRALTTLTLVAGFASTIFAPLTTALGDHLGWRHTYLVLATMVLLIAPVHLLALDRPWIETATTETHFDRTVLRSPMFLVSAGACSLVTLAEYASLIALVPLVLARGFSPATAAWILGLGGAGQVAGRLVYPALSRRMGPRARAATISGAVTVTIGALAVVPGPAGLLVTLSLLAGAARGLFTLLGATIVGDLWGTARYASLNGVFGAPLAVTGALGPLVGASIAVGVGGYPACFALLAMVAAIGASLLAAILPRRASRDASPSR